MASPRRVPGIYFQPQVRTPRPIDLRTDVAGFVGFEPRVRDASSGSRLTFAAPGDPLPSGHRFRVDVLRFRIEAVDRHGNDIAGEVRGVDGLVLSEDPASVPMSDGEEITYALVAWVDGGEIELASFAGSVAPAFLSAAPTDDDVGTALAVLLGDESSWARVADVSVRRDGDSVWPTVIPALRLGKCEDWSDFELRFGEPREDGTLLARSVRAYFANGGARCHVATIRRPVFTDTAQLARARDEIVGFRGANLEEATGLERFILGREVSFVDVPDLYARRSEPVRTEFSLPPREEEADFVPCRDFLGGGATGVAVGRTLLGPPIFSTGTSTSDVFVVQRDLLARVIADRQRILLLLSVPIMPDTAAGGFSPPAVADAESWRNLFDDLVKTQGFAETREMAGATLWFPWVEFQDGVGREVFQMPPSAFAAGVMARRDTARGPHVAPANETVRAVVGLTATIDDETHGRLYEADVDSNGRDVPSVNVLRAFAGYGIQVWGARTLSTEKWLRYISVRRCLTAIERRVERALEPIVFEPNTPLLWLQVSQLVYSELLPLHEAGELRGARPEDSFYVVCDGSVNPPEAIAAGRLVCEAGVAIAAPGEFLVFRVGRAEGVIEVVE